MSNYYLHRISYEEDIAYPLLDKENYLSIGFGGVPIDNKLYEIVAKNDRNAFNEYIRKASILWRFLNFKKDDLILVPKPHKFSVYKIIGDKFIQNDDKELTEALTKLNLNNKKNEKYKLGFFWKVEPVAKNISRDRYADALLTRRMHYRATNIKCNDIKDSIDNAIKGFNENKPINLFADIIDDCCKSILKLIKEKLEPNKFEKLLELYFEQCGANDVYKPSKTDNKEGDCDIDALFEPIKTIIHVQAKFYEGTAGKWAIEQINDFIDNTSENDGYSHIGWVISTCDDFSEDEKKLAFENNILLINGKDFAEMLIRAGVSSLEGNI